MSAGPERIFSSTKHTIDIERVSLSARMIEMTESLKSWIHVPQGRTSAVLAGVFRKRKVIDDAIAIVEEQVSTLPGSEDEIITLG